MSTVKSADTHPLTWRLDPTNPCLDLKSYEAKEGYAALRKAIKEMTPAAVQQVVKDSNLAWPWRCRFSNRGEVVSGARWARMSALNISSAMLTKWSQVLLRTVCSWSNCHTSSLSP
jgi:NADH:ubiquinone oxidoreductase subunit F (NADH-binding)